MMGSGCTDGEFCLRFPEEDLRKPIIQDNLSDESILQELLEKHRLEDWFERTVKAGTSLAQAERHGAIEQDATEEQQPAEQHLEPAAGTVDAGAERHREVDQDVEMQGS